MRRNIWELLSNALMHNNEESANKCQISLARRFSWPGTLQGNIFVLLSYAPLPPCPPSPSCPRPPLPLASPRGEWVDNLPMQIFPDTARWGGRRVGRGEGRGGEEGRRGDGRGERDLDGGEERLKPPEKTDFGRVSEPGNRS